jgi:hypothetical protein
MTMNAPRGGLASNAPKDSPFAGAAGHFDHARCGGEDVPGRPRRVQLSMTSSSRPRGVNATVAS